MNKTKIAILEAAQQLKGSFLTQSKVMETWQSHYAPDTKEYNELSIRINIFNDLTKGIMRFSDDLEKKWRSKG